ncbi:MAG: hypothetical protein RLZZ281_499, partial [Pseudomonadota bacterium]
MQGNVHVYILYTIHHQLQAGHTEVYTHPVQPTLVLVLGIKINHYTAACDSIHNFFKPRHIFFGLLTKRGRWLHIMEANIMSAAHRVLAIYSTTKGTAAFRITSRVSLPITALAKPDRLCETIMMPSA